jgi:L-lactate dehydrogenase complex protein LldF
MNQEYDQFIADSRKKSSDLAHREIIRTNMAHYDPAVKRAEKQFSNLQLARKRAGLKKHFVLEHLEDHLKTFEHNFVANGGRVIWAQDAGEARRTILEICEKHQVRSVVKSKSMVTEEIGLTECLEKNGIESLETDLGEYIVQITGDRPYHIITPIMHLSAKEVAGIFHEKFGLPEDASPEDIAGFVRHTLREKFLHADAGITGANFLVAEPGAVALTENEGNGVFSMAAPRVHIAVAGMEKIISSANDLDLFWPLLSTFGTGQNLSAYNSLVGGPRTREEVDGPEYMYVVVLDNGRSRLLATTPQRRALSCIRCGACLNVCPVYRNIGGHAYGTVYSGPIGAVISPHLLGNLDAYKHLSFASTLCGKCTEVCPVGIDLHYQLLQNRRMSVKSGLTTRPERWAMWGYKMAMKKRSRLDRFSGKTKGFLFRRFFGKAWGEGRLMPEIAPVSFAGLRAGLYQSPSPGTSAPRPRS